LSLPVKNKLTKREKQIDTQKQNKKLQVFFSTNKILKLKIDNEPIQFKRTSSFWVFKRTSPNRYKSFGQKGINISLPSPSSDVLWRADSL